MIFLAPSVLAVLQRDQGTIKLHPLLWAMSLSTVFSWASGVELCLYLPLALLVLLLILAGISLLWGIIPYHGLVCSPKSSFSGPFSLDFLILISLSLPFYIKYLLLLQLINYHFVMQFFSLNKITLNLKLFCCVWSQKTWRKSHFETRTKKNLPHFSSVFLFFKWDCRFLSLILTSEKQLLLWDFMNPYALELVLSKSSTPAR